MEQQQLSPELIQMLLGSNITEEEKQVLRQQLMAQQLGSDARSSSPRGGGAAGGAMGAIAQGLQGYMSGKMGREAKAESARLGTARGDQRKSYFGAMYPQQGQQPAQPTQSAQPFSLEETEQQRMLREQQFGGY